MTRGRKKDHTIPLNRSLVLQRDYRERKARYISDLEQRCKAAEEENVRLSKELETVKMGGLSLLNAETAHASAELMKDLLAASASLTKFERLIGTPSATPSTSSNLHATPSASLTPSSPPPPVEISSSMLSLHNSMQISGQDTSSGIPDPNQDHPENLRRHSGYIPSPSPSLESCCGGYVDCEDLVEEINEEHPADAQQIGTVPMMRMSGIRSTSDEGARERLNLPVYNITR